jgi:hypothetical protein
MIVKKPMEYIELHRTIEESQGLMAQFIQTELDLAITFCQGATSTTDESKMRRNIAYAQTASGASKHFVRYLKPEFISSAVIDDINYAIVQLEVTLAELQRSSASAA